MTEHRGKSVNQFLLDGTPQGIIKCTISNWTGVVYKIPRSELEQCKNRAQLTQSGIYFLFWEEEDTGNPVIYVGQAGVRLHGSGMIDRLKEHARSEKKYYWTQSLVVVVSDNSFGPTEISYLESRLHAIVSSSKRYSVANDVKPNAGNVTEEKECELEQFIQQTLLQIRTLGYQLECPAVPTEKEHGLTLYLERTKKDGQVLKASCVRTSEGFTLLAGSVVSLDDAPYLYAKVKAQKARATISPEGVLQEPITFTNPSYASGFVTGTTGTGDKDWKTKEGQTLAQYNDSILTKIDYVNN